MSGLARFGLFGTFGEMGDAADAADVAIPRSINPSTLVESIRGRDLSDAQRRNAKIIVREFARAGYSTSVVLAALANAWAESRFDAKAIGDNGHSVGLFQLNDRGAGAGMTVETRQDPEMNARTLIAREKWPLLIRVVPKKTAREATSAFAWYVERPADKSGESAKRAALVDEMFPDWSRVPADSLPKIHLGANVTVREIKPIQKSPWFWSLLGLGVAGLVTTGMLSRRRATVRRKRRSR